jgi:cold shock CspA family protein
MLTGIVTEFDGPRGLGAVKANDGANYMFHCIEIADGTRTIDVGQHVSFDPLLKFGQYQAGRINKR